MRPSSYSSIWNSTQIDLWIEIFNVLWCDLCALSGKLLHPSSPCISIMIPSHGTVLFLVILSLLSISFGQVAETSTTWQELKPESSIWTARNGKHLHIHTCFSFCHPAVLSYENSNNVPPLCVVAHASCVYNGKIYVVVGHTDSYPTYDLQLNDKTADVWWSVDGSK